MTAHHGNEWTRHEVERLREWRSAGHGPVELAARLGRSVGSVTAKIKKLGLPPLVERPAPPPRDEARPVMQPIPRAGKVTLPPLPSLMDN